MHRRAARFPWLRASRFGIPTLLICLNGVCNVRSASADDSSADPARDNFNRGVDLFDKGDFVGAIEQFELADKAHHTPSITYNLGRARDSLGLAQAAFEAYEAYLSEAGSQAQFFDAATVSLARIRTRATRLRIETEPQGAAVRIDGALLRDKSPATMLVFRGRHRIEVELGGWVEGRDIEAEGGGKAATVRIERPKLAPTPKPLVAVAPKPPEHVFSGLNAGVGFSLNYAALLVPADKASTTSSPTAPKSASLRFGLTLETGYALSPRSVVMIRGQCGYGSDAKALFSLGSLTLGYSFRATARWWIGGGATLGSSNKAVGATYTPLVGANEQDKIVFVSNPSFGPSLEAGLVLGDNEYGQWVLSILPSILLGTGAGQSTLYVPLVIGHRWY